MAKIKIEITIINAPTSATEKYDTTENFESSFNGNQESYLDLISKVIPLLPREV